MHDERPPLSSVSRMLKVPRRLSFPSWSNTEVAGFAATNLLATTSAGLVLATMVLFFSTKHNLSFASLTSAASVGGFVALAIIPIVGRIARSVGSRKVYTATLLLQSVVLMVWQFTSSVISGTIAVVVFSLCSAALGATVGGLIVELKIPAHMLAAERAKLRTITNVGIGLGGIIATLLLRTSSEGARISIILASGFTFLAFLSMLRGSDWCALLKPREVRSVLDDSVPVAKTSVSSPYRDMRYVGLFVSNGILSTHTEVLTYVIPAVVLLNFSDKTSLVGVATTVNACIVILFQLRNTKRAATLSRVQVTTVAATATVAMVILLAGSSQFSGSSALVFLLAGVFFLTIGELWQSSAEFDISYAAAPQSNHQEYQAAYVFGRTLARSIAPVFLGWVVVNGNTGWLLLCSVYLFAGIAQIGLASKVKTLC